MTHLVVEASSALKLVPKFSPEIITINAEDMKNFMKGCEPCDSLKKISIFAIKLCLPGSVEKVSFDMVFKYRKKVAFPSNLRTLELGKNAAFSQLDITKCDKLESLIFMCCIRIDENHPQWKRLPKCLKSIEFQFNLLSGDRFDQFHTFGMTINDDMEDSTITFNNKEDMLLCINKDGFNDEAYEDIKNDMNIPTCVINNVRINALITAAKGRIFLISEKEDEKSIVTKDSTDLPFKLQRTTEDDIMILRST
ncbi:unnamed protein product [Ambrosiozyma monospora]|uniref:Unnamed protein product n=1 Tax=Ambrosiozyma monospora TaxID=43982 RepID=A0ACB5T113_AMBMO|nr:unnamed protein product [Ambrosiozyma monospora]